MKQPRPPAGGRGSRLRYVVTDQCKSNSFNTFFPFSNRVYLMTNKHFYCLYLPAIGNIYDVNTIRQGVQIVQR